MTMSDGRQDQPNKNAVSPSGSESAWIAALKSTLYAFILSRALIAMAAALTIAYTTQWPLTPAFQTMRIFDKDFLERAESMVLQDDAGWYLHVVENGYERREFDASKPANWAFFPMHPWIWRAAIHSGMSPRMAGLILANAYFFFALLFVHRWVAELADRATADRAVTCIALFPTSYFFAMPFSEPLYIFLLAACLLMMQTKNWIAAMAFAGIASGSRVVGILLAPLLWWQAREDVPLIRRTLLAVFAGTGLAVFMYVLWTKTGNPLAFAGIQLAWGRNHPDLIKPFTDWLNDPLRFAESWNVIWLNLPSLLLGLAASAYLCWRRRYDLALFVFLYLLLGWSSGQMMGMARYVNACVPIFFVLACWLQRPKVYQTWTILSACMLVWMVGCYTLGATLAGA